ncbi:MAG: helix-turn-helix domain-containing protein [Euryarchaeota archaeon]|nr:helix-turn-helix domain-containing protein [Euryarchaeota archaeon]
MTHDPSSQPHTAAIAQLEWFNLSTYAARTFVALRGLGAATAKEVSQAAEVPRTRVYDAVDELADRGLVDVRESSPQRFVAVSAETLRRKLEADTTHRLSVLTTALSELEPAASQVEQRGIWTVDDRAAIADRLHEFVDEADEEIVYLATDDCCSAALVERFSAAADRGVSIAVGGLSADRWAELRAEVPSVTEPAVPSLPPMVCRLLIVDGEQILVSARPDSDTDSETAIWTVGETNGLVVVLRSLFGLDADPIDE